MFIFRTWTIPVAARSEAWVCGRCFAGIESSNSAGVNDVCLLWVLYVFRLRFLRRADNSYREVPQSVVCLIVIAEPKNEESLDH